MKKVLRIRNVPTTSAMTTNTSRNVLMNPSASAMVSFCSSAALSPVTASRPSGSSASTASRSSRWSVLPSVVTQMSV
jgi:hypothetical protein